MRGSLFSFFTVRAIKQFRYAMELRHFGPVYISLPFTFSARTIARRPRSRSLQTWKRLPPHNREMVFDLHGPGWAPAVITQLGEVLAEFWDVLSKFSIDFGSCSLLRFENLIPPNRSPVTSQPYRINPLTPERGTRFWRNSSPRASSNTPHHHGRAQW